MSGDQTSRNAPSTLRSESILDGVALTEVRAVWGVLALVLLAVFVTYARISPEDLYNVSHSGIRGGASRVLVYLNYPIAIVAVALVGIIYDRWRFFASSDRGNAGRVVALLSLLAVVCCLLIAVPGVVDEDDLDAKVINIVPAVGVLIILGLTILTFARHGVGVPHRWSTGDRIRLWITILLFVVSIPWYLAALGFYSDDIPGLNRLFIAEVIPAGEDHAAVHLGDHHGLSGSLLAIIAIWLTRALGQMRPTRLRGMVRGYLSLMLAYGLGNFLNDGWLEQVVKRGWADWRVPNLTTPGLTVAWGVIVLSAICFALILRRADGSRSTSRVPEQMGTA